MSTRLRYTKKDDGSFVSKPVITQHDIVTVKTVGLDWMIVSSEGEIIKAGTAKSNVDLKKTIKLELKGMGAQFLDEVRNKNKVVL